MWLRRDQFGPASGLMGAPWQMGVSWYVRKQYIDLAVRYSIATVTFLFTAAASTTLEVFKWTHQTDHVAVLDEAPDVLCWSQDHLIWYIIPAVLILGPYYCACVEMLSKSQARQSVVVIDRICGLISFQGRVLLAVLSAAVDDCHPWILVSSAVAVVLSQLVLIVCDRDYTSVLVLNAVRVGGLGMATVNGIYAAFVMYLLCIMDCIWKICM